MSALSQLQTLLNTTNIDNLPFLLESTPLDAQNTALAHSLVQQHEDTCLDSYKAYFLHQLDHKGDIPLSEAWVALTTRFVETIFKVKRVSDSSLPSHLMEVLDKPPYNKGIGLGCGSPGGEED